MTTCIELNDLPFPVKLEQASNGKFRVTYGHQITTGLNYEEAARELGESIMHALACEHKLTN